MPKPYVIVYKIDDSDAQAAFQRSMANAKATEQAWNKAAWIQSQSTSRQSRHDENQAKAAKRRMAEIRSWQDEKLKAISKAELAENKRLERVERAFYKNEESIQKIKDRSFMQEWRRGNQREARIQKAADRELERERANYKVRNALADDHGRRQMSWLERAAKVHLAFMALRGAGTLVNVGLDANRAMREKGEEFGSAMFAAMAENRALASVMNLKNTEGFAKKQAEFNVETGMGGGAGQKFRETFRGRAQSVMGVNLSDKEFEKFERESATLIASKGLDPGLAGDIAGAIAKSKNFKQAGQGAKEALAETANVLAILDAHAGRLQELAPNFAATVATLVDETGGVLKTAQEAAVGLSVMAEFKPAEGEVFERRGFAALRDFKDKNKRRFFQKSGITGKTEGLAHFDLAIKAIDEEMKTTGVKVDEAIANLGFKEQREVIALKTLYNSREKVFAHAKGMMNAITTEGAQGLLDEARKGLDFQMRAATARIEAARVRAGERELPLAIGMAEAEAQMIDQDVYRTWAGTIKQWTAAWKGGFLNYKPTEAGQKGLQEEMALEALSKQAGVPTMKGAIQSHILSMVPQMVREDKIIGESVIGITNALSNVAATLVVDPAKDARRLNELNMINKMLGNIITSALQGAGNQNAPKANQPAAVNPRAGAVRGP